MSHLVFFCGVFSNWCIFVLQALTRASLTIPNTLYTPSPTQVSALSVRCVLFFPGGWGGGENQMPKKIGKTDANSSICMVGCGFGANVFFFGVVIAFTV
jgi:hypothetical protein